MALPWPFLGAGMKVLPRPGAWMSAVNRVFGVVILLFAMWYAHLALCGWSAQGAGGSAPRRADGAVECTPATFESAMREAAESGKPVFVDCWATWCKNCAAMERTTLADERVKAALSRYAVIRLDATDVGAFRELKPFAGVQGLPAYAVFAAQEETRR
jgi:thiol:disulfide interchange protein